MKHILFFHVLIKFERYCYPSERFFHFAMTDTSCVGEDVSDLENFGHLFELFIEHLPLQIIVMYDMLQRYGFIALFK